MNQWFRSYHGAPTDTKWLLIARMAGVKPGMVSAIYWALLDHASQTEPRGLVAGFDDETYSEFAGFDRTQTNAVIEAMREKGVINNFGMLSAWEKRQPSREDDSAARAKAWRNKKIEEANATERNRTQPNARLEEIRVEEIREEKSKSAAAPPRPRFVPPTLTEVSAYATERGTASEASGFVDYFTSRGWKVGRGGSPMVDWRAAFRTWERNAKNFAQGGASRGESPRDRRTRLAEPNYDPSVYNRDTPKAVAS